MDLGGRTLESWESSKPDQAGREFACLRGISAHATIATPRPMSADRTSDKWKKPHAAGATTRNAQVGMGTFIKPRTTRETTRLMRIALSISSLSYHQDTIANVTKVPIGMISVSAAVSQCGCATACGRLGWRRGMRRGTARRYS